MATNHRNLREFQIPMHRSFSSLVLAIVVATNIAYAAPVKPAVKPATKPVVKPPKIAAPKKPVDQAAPVEVPAPNEVVDAEPSTPADRTVDSVVVINAVTRNNTPSQSELVLAENNKASLPIIISAAASDATKVVAADLADILKRMSGATFEVKTGDGKTGLVLGNIGEFPNPALEDALEIFNGFDGKEAYAIRTSEDRVFLLGATDLGASHAAYRLLRELGYRSFFPDKVWEVVPQLDTLTFARDITDRPEILSRDIWFEAGSGDGSANDDYKNWKRRNSQAQSFVSNAGHNLFNVPPSFPEEFKAHPEYYAQTAEGNPIMDDLELVNPEVRKIVIEYARRYFKANPNADMVSIDPTDRPDHSKSPEALKTSYSDQIFGVANEVARMLQEEFPGKMVGLYSYSGHWDPPSFELEPNVHVVVASLGGGNYTYAEREEKWPTLSKNRGIYDYFNVFLWSKDTLSGASWVNQVDGAQQTMKARSAGGVSSISAESTSNWGINGRGYMATSALMWNPHIDLDEYLEDFYTKAFGPGAPAMERYFERLVNTPFISKQLIAQALRDVDEASRLAADRPDVQARLDFIKLYLRYTHLEWAQNREGKADAGEEIASLYYRTRDRAIFSWGMAGQTWWGGKDWSAAKYQQPYTHEEIEKGFQESLEYFPVRNDIGDAVKYSDDLVAVSWTPEQKGEVTITHNFDWNTKEDLGLIQAYQGGARYGLYSVNGEPLEFSTWAGDAYGGINRLTITDSKGVEIAKKDKIPNKELTSHTIEVPGPGLYWLDYSDSGSYWSIKTPEDLIISIPLGQKQDYRNMWYVPPQMFFYVPKGIKNIEYYYSRTSFHPGGPHKVVDPTGTVVKDVDVNGDWVSVPVAEGMDGKIWSFQNPVLGFFTFNNLPNLYAPAPDGVLVPREVVEKDGLDIRQ